MYPYITLALILLFIFSYRHEPRKLINAPLLLLIIIFSILSVISIAYERNEVLHTILLRLLYGFVPLLIAMTGVFLIFNGVVIIKKEGFAKANFLSLLLGVGILVFFLAAIYLITMPFEQRTLELIYVDRLFWLFFFVCFLAGFSFLAFFLYNLLYLRIPKKNDYDFIIIHGAGLLEGERLTPLLKGRVDKALKAYRQSENPNTKIIASGGQGADEKISEAQAIANYLYDQGLSSDKVLLEDRSTSTYENLEFSKALAENEIDDPRFLFVSNDYHILRTVLYARKLKMRGEGLGTATSAYYVPTAYIREFLAMMLQAKWVYIVLIALCIVFLLISLI